MRSAFVAFCAAAIGGLAMQPIPALGDDASAEATAVVQAFNSAITGRDTDTAVAQLADGGVQFTLRSMHDGMDPDKLTAELAGYWSTIIPVMFVSTTSYTRDVEILSAEAHGDIATVWANTSTVSVRKGSETPATSEFTETYVLAKSPGGWKIVSIANNRPTTSIGPN